MKRVRPRDDWPQSWKLSYHNDLVEVFGSRADPGHTYSYRLRLNKTIELIREVVSPGATVLDLAAAQGNFSLLLAELGYRVTWNDLRAELADYVRLKYEVGELAFAPGNAFDLAFAEPFDVVIINEVIEHVAHPDQLLRRAAELARPGGHIVMTTPNGAYLRNRLPRFSDFADPSVFETAQFKPDGDGHIFLLWPDEIERLAVAAGLKLETLCFLTNSLTRGHMKLAPLLRWLPPRLVLGIEGATQQFPAALQRRLMVTTAARFRRPE
jgi:2-polyprenyl-6-hydroxyphenyl methylase/3-demethylubiquinone-9 3-methyltransferase